MRLKAIPEEAVEFAAKNPLLLGGVAVIGVVGFMYLHNNQAVAPDADVAASTAQPSYGSYGFAPLSTGGIISSPSVGGGGSGSIVDSVSNTAATDAIAQGNIDRDYNLKRDMFDFEVKKSDQANALAYAQLNANMAVAALNADIAYQGIQTSNYQTSVALAQSFLMSGKQLAMGGVTMSDGTSFDFGFTAANFDGSKKGKAANRIYNETLGKSGFLDYMAKLTAPAPAYVPSLPSTPTPQVGVAPRATLTAIGSGATAAYAGAPTPPPVQSGGSAIAAAVDASSRYDRLPSYKRGQIRGDAYDLA